MTTSCHSVARPGAARRREIIAKDAKTPRIRNGIAGGFSSVLGVLGALAVELRARRPWRLLAVGAAALVLLAVRPASAQPAELRQLDPAAQEHLDRASAAYAAREYDRALEELRAAYAIDPRPDLVYAQAQALRGAGRCAAAIERYRAFLALSPPPVEAARAERHIARCGETLRVDRARAAVARRPVRAAGPAPLDAWGIVLGGAGLAAVGTGVGFLVWASTAEDAAEHAPDYPTFLGHVDDAEARRLVGTIALVAGGTLVAVAVLRIVLRARADRAPAVALRPAGVSVAF